MEGRRCPLATRGEDIPTQDRVNRKKETPEVVEMARKLARKRPKGGKLKLREISTELQNAGFVTSRGEPCAAAAVAKMLAARERAGG